MGHQDRVFTTFYSCQQCLGDGGEGQEVSQVFPLRQPPQQETIHHSTGRMVLFPLERRSPTYVLPSSSFTSCATHRLPTSPPCFQLALSNDSENFPFLFLRSLLPQLVGVYPSNWSRVIVCNFFP
ncbi:hypothetical protein E2C01_044792 [Portunus trituberculatus]|uniref:Uncharacterized protein n=1 Tax=Portunus trituberculatus TaxID=210409 RepID=A0A5B7G047_PORTR|nr:hypothetical protein [Portunus trituberculatus]